jgi:hypothetical protein
MASNPADLAAAYEARTAEYEERCRFRTTTEMTSGTARNAPKGPHIHAKKAIDRKTRKEFKAWRCPIIVGVMNCPSKVVTKIQIIGATKAALRVGKVTRPIIKSVATITAGPR